MIVYSKSNVFLHPYECEVYKLGSIFNRKYLAVLKKYADIKDTRLSNCKKDAIAKADELYHDAARKHFKDARVRDAWLINDTNAISKHCRFLLNLKINERVSEKLYNYTDSDGESLFYTITSSPSGNTICCYTSGNLDILFKRIKKPHEYELAYEKDKLDKELKNLAEQWKASIDKSNNCLDEVIEKISDSVCSFMIPDETKVKTAADKIREFIIANANFRAEEEKPKSEFKIEEKEGRISVDYVEVVGDESIAEEVQELLKKIRDKGKPVEFTPNAVKEIDKSITKEQEGAA